MCICCRERRVYASYGFALRHTTLHCFMRLAQAAQDCAFERRFVSDVTDEEWVILEPLLPAAKKGGTIPGN